MEKRHFGIIAIIAISVFASRIIPHSPNFTASLAGLIFGGAVLRKSIYAVLLVICYFLADLILNNVNYASDHIGFQWTSQSFYWIYISLFLTFFISRIFTSKMENPFKIIGLSIGSSLIFYLLTNFGVWLENLIYIKNTGGLIACFIAGLPFLLNELAGSLFFSCLFFGTYWLYESRQKRSSLTAEWR
ncbi:MAG: DUF6580 family putative transport protein [Saprospiraceae bacterium]